MAVGNTEAEPLSMVLAPWNAAKAPSLCLGPIYRIVILVFIFMCLRADRYL